MIGTLRELLAHQAWADAALLNAVLRHPPATQDEPLRKTLHHIGVVQLFFTSLMLDREFDAAVEVQPPAQTSALIPYFQRAAAACADSIANLTPDGLERPLPTPYFKDNPPTVREALLQLILHSQNHRGQCATRLRELGGQPPVLDYIIWKVTRPEPQWD